MRTQNLLISEHSSPYIKRLVLMKRAGIKLNDKQKKRLSESVSQVLPIKYHDRMGIQNSSLKQFKDLEDDDELDLSELMDDEVSDEDSELFDAILKEMGYGDDDEEEYEPTIDMEDIPELTDEELEEIIRELEYATGEYDDD
jgi:hypothetical protein|tara:strand:+ start:362 stop:787 length:426 start_codon:yes stop_codon:yes gene_type:complete